MTSSPSELFQQFYQSNPTAPPPSSAVLGGRPSDATVISTAAPAATPGPLSPVQNGRVSKPARRRSRAARKNPTTLVNTDTTNFRAMVQSYTGGANTYLPFHSPAGFNGLHQGQMGNFDQQGSFTLGMNYPSSAAISLQANHLHQQLLRQHGTVFSSTANINSVPATSTPLDQRAIGLDQDGVSSLTHVGARVGVGPGFDHYPSSSTGGFVNGGGENKGGGFVF